MKPSFQYTGHPIVDTGLAVMMARAKELKIDVKKITDLTPQIIEQLVTTEKDWLSNVNRKLSSYTMVFSSNGPLTNASSNPELVLKGSERKVAKAQTALDDITKILSGIENELKSEEEKLKSIIDSKKIDTQKKKIEAIKKKIKKSGTDLIKKQENLKNTQEKLNKHESKKKRVEKEGGLEQYKTIIQDLIGEIKTVAGSLKCEATGLYPASEAIEKNGKSLGKEWFPLLGSIQDAQTYPASSRTFRVSAIALLATQFLPMGVGIIGKRLVCFQSNDYASENIPLFQSIVEQIYNDTINRSRLLDKVETWGKGNVYNNITLLLLNYLTRIEEEKQEIDFEHLCLNLWLFSNSGQEPALEAYELPNMTLKFLWQAWRGIHKSEIENYIRTERNLPYSLLECIKEQKEYKPFYPAEKEISVELKEFRPNNTFVKYIEASKGSLSYNKKENTLILKQPLTEEEIRELYRFDDSNLLYQEAIKKLINQQSQSASIELFELYNLEILGHTEETLSIIKWLAEKILESGSDMQIWRKKVEFNKLRDLLVEVIPKGFKYEYYLNLFPCNVHPIRLNDKNKDINCNIIRYYLFQTTLSKTELPMLKEHSFAHPKYSKVKYFAKDFFDFYIAEEGKERFKKRIINAFSNNQIKPQNIENWFAWLAEAGKDGYTNEEWDDLCRNESGENEIWEIIFQLRLELANLYYQKYSDNN